MSLHMAVRYDNYGMNMNLFLLAIRSNSTDTVKLNALNTGGSGAKVFMFFISLKSFF